MKSGIDVLPLSILQNILTMGRLEAVDLASLDASSCIFRAPSGNVPGGFKSITEAAAHHYCEMYHVFKSLPSSARSELLARCEGNWKLVLHFLESLQRSSGRSSDAGAGNNNCKWFETKLQVLTAAGSEHTLMVNGKGELYACGKGGAVLGQGQASTTTVEIPRLISLPSTATRVVQISASFEHAAFVTETGQVYTFGDNTSGCCGIGMRARELKTVLKPTRVRTLSNFPCQQVTTGKSFTMALTRLGEVYSWGCNMYGQLGHGNTRDKSTARQIDHFDGSDPVVQVSAGERHSLAVTKSGQLFSWGYGHDYALGDDVYPVVNNLLPKRVVIGGFHDLFIVSAVAGNSHSVAIDYCGRVYKMGNEGYPSADARRTWHRDAEYMAKRIPVLVTSLKDSRAIQVVARGATFALLDNGTVYCLSGVIPFELWQGRYFAIVGDKAHSMACGQEHALVATKKGAILGLGYNFSRQLGAVWGGADLVVLNTLVEVFSEATIGTERAAEGSCSTRKSCCVGICICPMIPGRGTTSLHLPNV